MTHTEETYAMITQVLDRTGYRPFGSDGSAWEHPTGTRITTGYTGGQIRLRRFVPGNDRFDRIPPVIWDIRDQPTESEVSEFVGQRSPAPELSDDEKVRLAQFGLEDDAPESFRARIIQAIGDEMDALGLAPGRFYAPALADAALAVVRGEA